MSDSNEPVQIEIEDENENENEENEVLSEAKSNEIKPQIEVSKEQSKLKIARKKVDELTEQEKAQLISDAQHGKENEYYHVKLFKNGKTKISLKKQSKAQQLIQSNESNVEKVLTPTSRYLTDNQLLFEHIINLETQYNKLHAKHKKLKRRYNDLEGYLYANDSDSDEEEKRSERTLSPSGEPKKAQKTIQEQIQPEPIPASQQQQSIPQPEIQSQIQPQIQNPYVQRRYVKSWRDLRPQ